MNIPRRIITLYTSLKNKEAFYPLFRYWLLKGENRAETEDALEKLWKDTVPVSAHTGRAWKKVSSSIFPEENRKVRIRRIVWTAAACLALPLLSALVFKFVSDSRQRGPVLTEITVPFGQISTVMLPDSSSVTLNSGSVIVFPEEFPDSVREVSLDGEAIFNVRKDTHRPFIVKSPSVQTTVLGTVFNVKSYSGDDCSSVSVAEGRVAVRRAGFPESDAAVLEVSDMIVIDNRTGESALASIDPENVGVWKNGILEFKGAGIKEVIRTLERTFSVSIDCPENEKFADARITAKLSKSQTLTEILDILKKLIPEMEYRVDGSKVYLY